LGQTFFFAEGFVVFWQDLHFTCCAKERKRNNSFSFEQHLKNKKDINQSNFITEVEN
jgi:hypothetical protein